jgi:UDP-N-acetyl-D-mannosaminuronic acid transferase (WecB/TagA/CpsF family)
MHQRVNILVYTSKLYHNFRLASNKNPQVQNACNAAHYDVCVGMPVKWASPFLKTPIMEHITGLDLFPNLVALSSKNDLSIFYWGLHLGWVIN